MIIKSVWLISWIVMNLLYWTRWRKCWVSRSWWHMSRWMNRLGQRVVNLWCHILIIWYRWTVCINKWVMVIQWWWWWVTWEICCRQEGHCACWSITLDIRSWAERWCFTRYDWATSLTQYRFRVTRFFNRSTSYVVLKKCIKN